MVGNSAQGPLRNAADFVVQIAWNGPEDKPYYSAILVSQSQASLMAHEPFVGYAILSSQEYNRLLDALTSRGISWVAGKYTGKQSEYYVEVRNGERSFSGSLGAAKKTLETLKQIASALEPAHQKPIQDIIARVTATFQTA